MDLAAKDATPPRDVEARWRSERLAEGYRSPAPRRPATIVLRPARRGVAPASATGLLGEGGAALLFEHGLAHARALVTLASISVGVIAALLLDRLAPRMLHRTEVTFGDDALWGQTRPLGDPQPTRIAYPDVTGCELDEVVDPMAAPPVVVFTVNAREERNSNATRRSSIPPPPARVPRG